MTSKTVEINFMKSIPVTHLPLRPSTIHLLCQRGFETVSEVYDSKSTGGFANLAAELGCSLQQAHTIYHEIDQLIAQPPKQQERQPQQQQAQVNDLSNVPGSNLPPNRLSSSALKCSNSSGRITAVSALELVQEMENSKNDNECCWKNAYIITFCRELDKLLGGGIQLGVVTEIAGSPGTGKSQMCMQYSVNVALPLSSGGVQGQAIYIDTEGSFSPERCYSMAIALKEHVNGILFKLHKRQLQQQGHPLNHSNAASWDVTAEEILNGIHVFRVHDETSLIAVLNGPVPEMIEQFAKSSKPIRLIAIDSMAFPFRSASMTDGNNYFVMRTKQLANIVSDLGLLASKYNLAVIAVNQMTTKRVTTNNNNNHVIVPALGESWAHSVTIRLVLSMNRTANKERRTCTLAKSPSLPSGAIDYQVLESGIRGMDYRFPLSKSSSTYQQPKTSGQGDRIPLETCDPNSLKRQRLQE